MDPFDEFEFKPLTEGLGFHNRTPAKKAVIAPRVSRDLELELMAPEIKSVPRPQMHTQMNSPLPRREERTPEITNTNTTAKVDEILKTLGERRQFEFTEPEVAKGPAWATSRPDLSAILLDGMLVFAAYLGALIVLLTVTKIDLFGNLINPDPEGFIYMGLAGLLATVIFVYMTVHRMFLGCTPGEWVFDQRLGLPRDMRNTSYSIRVAGRAVLVIATGLITFPLLSFLLRRDLLSHATGVQMMKKV
jgi:hypothetical protein